MNKAVRNVRPIKGVEKDKVSVIILGAGESSKMKSHGPRPLLKISQYHTIISYQIHILRKHILNPEIILVCGVEADRVMNNTPNDIIKIENGNYKQTNVNRSIGLGLRAATGNVVLLVYGDLLFSPETISSMNFSESNVVIDNGGLLDPGDVGCTLNEHGRLEKMFYELPNKWGQIALARDKELYLLQKTAWDREKERWFGFEVINNVIELGGTFIANTSKKNKVLDIDTVKNMQHIKSII